MISEAELYVLSYYRASELAGALLFGKLAFHTTVDELRAPLTRHSMEEAEHAWRWTRTIQDLGRVPVKVTQTYQTEYGKVFGMPKDTLELLCLTQTLERRVLQHFARHLRLPATHPLVRATLQGMIEDEVEHVGWVRAKLDKYAESRGQARVEGTMARLAEADEIAYARISDHPIFQEVFGIAV